MSRFNPISLERYIALHLKSNRSESEPNFRSRLREAVAEKKAGCRCDCGEPIWAIGSAVAHYACFTCITGEADPSEDYEVDEVVDLC